MDGDTLVQELSDAAGLPKAWVEDELKRLLMAKGLPFEKLSLDLLREVLAEFMQDVLLTAKSQLSKP